MGRLLALAEYGLSESEILPELQPVVLIAARMLGMPMAAVNMVGSDHVFFAASTGLGVCDMSRDVSFCAHAITQDDVLLVPDATLDPRFHDNPLVVENGVRFYAGIPLRSPSRHALGALCVLDTAPHPEFTRKDCDDLIELARIACDKLELRRLERARASGGFAFENIAQTSPAPVACFDRDLRITFWNAAAVEQFGFRVADAVGQRLADLIAGGDPGLTAVLRSAVEAPVMPTIWPRCQLNTRRKDGGLIPLEVSLFGWTENHRPCFGAMLVDISEQRRQAYELAHVATHDPLTGLSNRDTLRKTITGALAAHPALAVLSIDLDHFGEINDSLGIVAGDRILSTVADRIRAVLRPIDAAARIGSDEFTVLLARVHTAELARAIAEDLLREIARPISVGGRQIQMSASCGIALAPEHGADSDELFGNAGLALYHAKTTAPGRAFVYRTELREQAQERRLIYEEMVHALQAGEFELYYQPQIRSCDGALVGAEALIRWNHPTRGLLTPGAFLHVLAATALSRDVGDWVLTQACEQLALWRASGLGGSLRVGINVFPSQIDSGFSRHVADELACHNLPPSALEIEITEDTVLGRGAVLVEALQSLRDMGVSIAFDDFGTGYASFSLLKIFPLTRLKIDQSFVRNLCTSRQDLGTVIAAIELARAHDLEVIAEGVETDEQRCKLAELRCDELQGYFFGRPMPATDFVARLAAAAPSTPAAQGCAGTGA